MTHTTEQERADFERTIGVDYDLTPSTIRQGQYAVPVTQAAWYGWQAARRAPAFSDDQLAKLIYDFEVAIDVARHSSDVASPDAEADEKAVNEARSKLTAYMGSRAPVVPVPQGWKLVPIEPTEKMISEGSCAQTLKHGHRYIDECAAKTAWSFMIAAAPQPPEAAPVQLPDPVAYIDPTRQKSIAGDAWMVDKSWDALYTEDQLSAILSQHGIKTK